MHSVLEEKAGAAPMTFPNVILFVVLVQGSFLLIGGLIAHYSNMDWMAWIQVQPLMLLLGAGVGGVAAFAFLEVSRRIGFLNTRLGRDHVILMNWIGRRSVWVIAFISLAAGISEELLYRAVLQSLAVEYFGVAIGVVGVAVFFGLGHAASYAYFLYATVVGLLLTLFYALSGDLLSTMMVHAAYDFVAIYLGIHHYNMDLLDEGGT